VRRWLARSLAAAVVPRSRDHWRRDLLAAPKLGLAVPYE